VTASSASTVCERAACQNQRDAIGCDHAGRLVAGAALDLAIMGNGYFVVRDPVTNECHATQAGHFSVDGNGCLLTGAGARLQGCVGGSLSTVGDLQINAAGLPPGSIPGTAMVCYTIDEWGKITVQLSDGAWFLCGQVMLQDFQDPQALISEGNGLYSNLSAAGPLPALAAPGSNGLGVIQSGALELAAPGKQAGQIDPGLFL
jgi:flagellar hook protein FlgE